MILAEETSIMSDSLIYSVVLAICVVAVVFIGGRQFVEYLNRREDIYGRILRDNLLYDVSRWTVTLITGVCVVVLATAGYFITESIVGVIGGIIAGMVLPPLAIKYLKRRRLDRLELQLTGAIQTLSSCVRAGLNLVQAMQMVARDEPAPIKQEFAHLMREYEYGVSLEEAMDNAAQRIDSGDFRLLFSALQTHRERGGDLGTTLDRIAASIQEIQRLENRVKALTAQGRATARWLAAMPGVVLLIMWGLIQDSGVSLLFSDNIGKLILVGVVVLNVIGYLWIRKIL